MNISVALSRALPPVNFVAWMDTCVELASMLAAKPGLVALVGPKGSGKTYTLAAFSHDPTSANRRASLRRPGQPLDPGTALDLVDDVDLEGLERLVAEPAYYGQRVIALRPDTLDALLRVHPNVPVISVRPMSPGDIRTMVDARRIYFRLPADAFTVRAFSALKTYSAGNPEALDDLCTRAIQIARIANASRIAAEHVGQAQQSLLAMDAVAHQAEIQPHNANQFEDTVPAGYNAALAGRVTAAGDEPGLGTGTSRPSDAALPPSPNDTVQSSSLPKVASEAESLLPRSPPEASVERTGPTVSAWDLLARPPSQDSIVRARRVKWYRASRYVVLPAVTISALAWIFNSRILERVHNFALTSALELGRYQVAADPPRAASLRSDTAPSSMLAAGNAQIAPLVVTLAAAQGATVSLYGSSDHLPIQIVPSLARNVPQPPSDMSGASDDASPGGASRAPELSGAIRDTADMASQVDAARLLAEAKALLAIGQISDAREMINAWAKTRNPNAIALNVTGSSDAIPPKEPRKLPLPERGTQRSDATPRLP